MHIVDMIYFWARTTPQWPAVIRPEGIVTYRALAQGIEAAAKHFSLVIKDRSKPVTVAVGGEPKMLIASLALLSAKFSIMVVHAPDIPFISASDSHTIVRGHDDEALNDRTNIVFEENWLRIGAGGTRFEAPFRPSRARDADVFFFTSGTTGRPKRAIRTGQAWTQRMVFRVSSAFGGAERALLLAGLDSSMGFSGAYEALYAGKTICFAPQGQPALWLANTYDIDQIIASPQQALALAEIQERVTRYPLTALRTIRLGGSIISPAGLDRIKNYLCRNVILTYSSTEAGIVALAPHDMIAHIPNAVGFLVPGAEVEIVDEKDNVLPAGAEGLVRLRTTEFLLNLGIDDPNVWFYPGDVGWLTGDGVLCIIRRKDDVINRGGVKLSIGDFEDFLRSRPGVKDAGVSVVMGSAGFEQAWIGVVLDPAADIGMLRQSIEGNTNFGTNIDRIFAVDAIPRGGLGKIQREELKKLLLSIDAHSGAQ